MSIIIIISGLDTTRELIMVSKPEIYTMQRLSRGRGGGTQVVLRAVLWFPDRHNFLWKAHTKWNDGLETRVPRDEAWVHHTSP